MDEASPGFSWNLDDSLRGAKQNAYQILIATSGKLLTDKKAEFETAVKLNLSNAYLLTTNVQNYSQARDITGP